MALRAPSAVLALEHLNVRLPVQVLAAGPNRFYLGSCDESGPVSRESLETWSTQHGAQTALALGHWTQRTDL